MNNLQLANRILLSTALLTLCVACAERREVRVQLDAHHPRGNNPGEIEVQAQVTGPQAGLRYKWFSVLGDFDPQESFTPKTSYTFASNTLRDRVWVEVWRENERVAQSEIDVEVDDSAPTSARPAPAARIEITNVPPYQPEGGPDTHADISGKVSGELTPGLRVLIYARADAWYIQPTPFTSHPIGPDGTWKTWTHTGASYAALVVEPTYKPDTRLDVLPQVEGDVVARTIVEGKRK